ncbi:nitrilase-related carbon-nitrogen hydrolase, partial [Clostridioides difficile]|uniref:nitrilase-related carbon-nitrogen hydrolase n=1 Tax=Clostridioides difficile TaxID=1496 RepID=UPI002E8DEBC6
MALKGAEIVIFPAAFNMTTGPAHCELSIRMRALDYQLFYVCAAPARNMNASYIAFGYLRISDPLGRIIAQAVEKECIVFADFDRAVSL